MKELGRLYRHVETRAQEVLDAAQESSFPVKLKELAKVQSAKIIFKPLFISGYVTVTGRGFNIYVSCPPEKIGQFQKRLREEGNTFLPSQTRFTIAHELGHTLFYTQKAGHRPQSLISASEREQVDKYEALCNFAAARLLLPNESFRSVMAAKNILEPRVLREIAENSAVSPEVLIFRIDPLSRWLNEDAAIMCAQKSGDTVNIKACSMHGNLGVKYRELRNFHFIVKRFLNSVFVSDHPMTRVVELSVTTGEGGKIQRFVVRSEGRASTGKWDKRFVTLLMEGGPTN